MDDRQSENGILSKLFWALRGLFVAFSYTVLAFLLSAVPFLASMDSALKRLVLCLIWLTLAFAAALIDAFTGRTGFRQSFRFLEIRKKSQAWLIPVGSVVAFVGGICLNRAVTVAGSWIPFPEKWVEIHDESVAASSSGDPFISVIALCLLAPLVEELAFRGKSFFCFEKAFGAKIARSAAVIVTSLLFAFVHGSFIQGLYAFVCGTLFALLSIACGSVIPCIFAHVGFNAANVILYTFFNGREGTGTVVNIVCAVLLAVCIGVFIVAGRILRGDATKPAKERQDIYIDPEK